MWTPHGPPPPTHVPVRRGSSHPPEPCVASVRRSNVGGSVPPFHMAATEAHKVRVTPATQLVSGSAQAWTHAAWRGDHRTGALLGRARAVARRVILVRVGARGSWPFVRSPQRFTGVGCGSEPGLRQAVLLGRGTHRPGVQWALLQPWAEVPCPRSRRLRAQLRGPRGGSLLPGAACGVGCVSVHLSTRTSQNPASCLHGAQPRTLLQAAALSTCPWF